MRVSDIIAVMESWAPKDIAWKNDSVGLQIGDPSRVVRGVFVCLDVSEAILLEARERGANLIVSHHPLLFKPPNNLMAGNPVADCIRLASQYGIDIYAAHTNLDFTQGGTSFALAHVLGLTNVGFLVKSYKTKKKIVTYVPPSHADAVAEAMALAGAGRIGNYEYCSFRTTGTGTFLGNRNSSPKTGRRGRLERVGEIRLEMIVDEWNVGASIHALIRAHPYEEAAYEIYPTENLSNEYGIGCIGTLKNAQRPMTFLHSVRKHLGTGSLRCSGQMTGLIQRVALCGGSGAELLGEAIRQEADAFVTADVKYHAFHDAGKEILLVDAGHYETEFPVVRVIARRIRSYVRGQRSTIPVVIPRRSTNPIMYV